LVQLGLHQIAKLIHQQVLIKKNQVRCLLLIDLNIFSQISSKTGKESIVILREDLERATLLIEKECILSVIAQFKKRRDKDSLGNV